MIAGIGDIHCADAVDGHPRGVEFRGAARAVVFRSFPANVVTTPAGVIIRIALLKVSAI
jgi:hypothetical protein